MSGPTAIGGRTRFDVRADNLHQKADEIRGYATDLQNKAKDALRKSGQAGGKALDHALFSGDGVILPGKGGALGNAMGAVGNAVMSGGYALETLAYTAKAGGHVAVGTGAAVVGAGGVAVEGLATGTRAAAIGASKGFGAIANGITGILGDNKTTTVRTLEGDGSAKRFSQHMFELSEEQFTKQAPQSLALAANAFSNSVAHASGAVMNTVEAAAHGALFIGYSAEAIAHLAESGAYATVGPLAVHLAALAVDATAISVRFAGKGLEGSREAAILGARINAAAANVLRQADQGKVEVSVVEQQIKEFERELAALQAAK
jgi:hypothetical protein